MIGDTPDVLTRIFLDYRRAEIELRSRHTTTSRILSSVFESSAVISGGYTGNQRANPTWTDIRASITLYSIGSRLIAYLLHIWLRPDDEAETGRRSLQDLY